MLLVFLMSYMYLIGYSGSILWKEGMCFGALLGVVSMLLLVLTFYGVMDIVLCGVFLDVVW